MVTQMIWVYRNGDNVDTAAAVSTLSPFLYTQIIWVTIISLVVFDQFPDQFSILGAAIVIGSGLYIWHRETLERNAT